MIKVFGERGSGKTTKLLQIAAQNNGIVVVPTFRHVACTMELAKKLDLDNVQIIAAREFIQYLWCPKSINKSKKFYIDELDDALLILGIEGYSSTIREEVSTT
jgi:hypothetical protein